MSYGRGDEKFDTGRMWKITLDEFDKNKDNQIQRNEMTEKFDVPMRPELTRDNPGYGFGFDDNTPTKHARPRPGPRQGTCSEDGLGLAYGARWWIRTQTGALCRR